MDCLTPEQMVSYLRSGNGQGQRETGLGIAQQLEKGGGVGFVAQLVGPGDAGAVQWLVAGYRRRHPLALRP